MVMQQTPNISFYVNFLVTFAVLWNPLVEVEAVNCYACVWNSTSGDGAAKCNCHDRNSVKKDGCNDAGTKASGTYCVEYYEYNFKYGDERKQSVIRSGCDSISGSCSGIPAAVMKMDLNKVTPEPGSGIALACYKLPEGKPKAGDIYQAACACNATHCNNNLAPFNYALSTGCSTALIIAAIGSYWILVNFLPRHSQPECE